MGLFDKFFHPIRAESLVLIDVSAESVGGAYARYKEGEAPSLLYTLRIPIETRDKEKHELAMLRALEKLGSVLISEGAPILMKETGSGSADSILVSVDAPWQETKIRTEYFEKETPFSFTEKMVDTALEKTAINVPGKVLVDESIIGTILNGYETNEPYGKKARRASIIILASLIDEKISENIAVSIRKLFHTQNIFSIAGSSLRYQAIRKVFPHEHDALILDTIGSLVSIALVRKNLLMAVSEVSDAISKNADLWIKKVEGEFTKLAERYPLPRTIFLLEQEKNAASLEQALNSAKLGGLWLSDNPPKVVPVLASHIIGSIKQVTTAPPDLQLLLMALYYQHRGML